MMESNLFPALLMAGPPNAGKSVLSFLLTWQLRKLNCAHYLLRAAPDGEGDWFHLGEAGIVRSLRLSHKGSYSPEFVARLRSIIENRLLPLLVDVGGKPQGDQFGILNACTHSILLHRTEAELQTWNEHLSGMNLLPIAELRSNLDGQDRIQATHPILRGEISGLDRTNWKTGPAFGALLDRVAGIFHYDESYLEQQHLKHAPHPPLLEREIARQVGIEFGAGAPRWEPSQLGSVANLIPDGRPISIYGRGPVWLAAMLAIQTLPASCSIFDARFGWVIVPEIHYGQNFNVKVSVSSRRSIKGNWAEVSLVDEIIEPDEIQISPFGGRESGTVLSGRLPRWLFAALARKLALHQEWIAIDDPGLGKAIIIYSRSPFYHVGDTIERNSPE